MTAQNKHHQEIVEKIAKEAKNADTAWGRKAVSFPTGGKAAPGSHIPTVF